MSRYGRGAHAAASHTGSPAGFDAAATMRVRGVRGALRQQHGECLDIADAAARARAPGGRRVAVMSNSGGMGAQMADYAMQTGFNGPCSPPHRRPSRRWCRRVGPEPGPSLTAQWLAEPNLIPGCLSALLDAETFDVVFCFMGSSGGHRRAPRHRPGARAAAAGADRHVHQHRRGQHGRCSRPRAVWCSRGRGTGDVGRRRAGRLRRALRALPAGPAVIDEGAPLPARTKLNEHAARRSGCLPSGVSTVPPKSPRPPRRSGRHAGRRHRLPRARSTLSADIPQHKTESGGRGIGPGRRRGGAGSSGGHVAPGLRDLRPEARIDCLLVGPMLQADRCIVGIDPDPVFGPLVTVGMGGIGVEPPKDVAWRRAPVSEVDAGCHGPEPQARAIVGGAPRAPGV